MKFCHRSALQASIQRRRYPSNNMWQWGLGHDSYQHVDSTLDILPHTLRNWFQYWDLDPYDGSPEL
ncbi:hypothetical protein M404DRAFT_1000388 [Pisolithus tinctorius Marx 270]|uniref:Uncharacterized protein n=1 Tax=Pisolithus tinctorius Marx 270 TaxID=870435 RepID=A0A0C3PAI3_PISTI|nr:hypothetical protein M404DRAFT_1000388 [Pisolithus tinctorius Marx 270]